MLSQGTKLQAITQKNRDRAVEKHDFCFFSKFCCTSFLLLSISLSIFFLFVHLWEGSRMEMIENHVTQKGRVLRK